MMKIFTQLASLGSKLVVGGLAGCELVTCLTATQNFSEKIPPQDECEAAQTKFSEKPTDVDLFASFLLDCVKARQRSDKERAAKGTKGKKGYSNVTIEQDDASPPAASSHGDKASGSARPAARDNTPDATMLPGARRGKRSAPEMASNAAAEAAAPRVASEFEQPLTQLVPDQSLKGAEVEVLQKWTRTELECAQQRLTEFTEALDTDTEESVLPQYKALVLSFPQELLAAFGIEANHDKASARTKVPAKAKMQQFVQKLTEVCRTAQAVIPPTPVPLWDLDESEEERQPAKKVAKSAEEPAVEVHQEQDVPEEPVDNEADSPAASEDQPVPTEEADAVDAGTVPRA